LYVENYKQTYIGLRNVSGENFSKYDKASLFSFLFVSLLCSSWLIYIQEEKLEPRKCTKDHEEESLAKTTFRDSLTIDFAESTISFPTNTDRL